MDIYRKDFCSKIIIASCCLHNICIINKDIYEMANSTELFRPDILQEIEHQENTSAVNKRNYICDLLQIN